MQMKPTHINHPLKAISLQYVSEAPLSEFETNFIEQYQYLHDGVLNMKERMLELRTAIARKKKEMKQPAKGYEKLKAEIRLYEIYLGLSVDDSLPEVTEYKINPSAFQARLDEYGAVMNKYWADIETVTRQYNDSFKMTEDFDKVFDKFEKQYERPFCKNHEKMEIDFASFDADLNAFKDQWTETYKLFESTVDEYDAWLEKHNEMATNIHILYDRIKKLFAFIASIQNQNRKDKGNSFSDN
jgi:hypothetical protein